MRRTNGLELALVDFAVERVSTRGFFFFKKKKDFFFLFVSYESPRTRTGTSSSNLAVGLGA